MAGLSKGQGDLDPDCLGQDIADAAIGAVTPRPAATDVEDAQFVACIQRSDLLSFIGRPNDQTRSRNQVSDQWFGVVRGNDAPGEAGVGKVLAIRIGGRIGQVGRAGERKAISDGRRRVPFRVVRPRGGRLGRLHGDIF